MEEAANGSFSGGFCDWCHNFIDPVVSGGFERIDGGRLWCGLCPRFPATEALHDADRFARRAQRLLEELEPERLDEFEADLDMLSDAVADLRMILDQRRGLRPPPAEHGSRGSTSRSAEVEVPRQQGGTESEAQ